MTDPIGKMIGCSIILILLIVVGLVGWLVVLGIDSVAYSTSYQSITVVDKASRTTLISNGKTVIPSTKYILIDTKGKEWRVDSGVYNQCREGSRYNLEIHTGALSGTPSVANAVPITGQ